MPIQALNHFTVLTRDLDASLHFYVRVLGLTIGARPELPSSGAWLYLGEQAVLHVIVDPRAPERNGVIDHVAFTGVNLPEVTARLRSHGIQFELVRQPGSGTWQLFLFEPSGGLLEINFDASESEG
ncbi:MAG TPA: VOC family protein [Polyangiaceae bacterium]|nr:VOC family protein [Polyangiaceae bacterium]